MLNKKNIYIDTVFLSSIFRVYECISSVYLDIVITHMDEFVDSCLRNRCVLEVDLPLLPKRHILETTQGLAPRISVLELEEG